MEIDNAKVKSNSNGINILSFLLNIKSEIIARQTLKQFGLESDFGACLGIEMKVEKKHRMTIELTSLL